MANALWPDLKDLGSSQQACRNAAGACFVVAAITGLVAALALAGTTLLPGIDGWALVDAGIFALLGLFLRRFSRIAAVFALVLFLLERILMLAEHPTPAGLPLALILAVFLIGGVRGSFAYHRLLQQQNDAQAKAAGSSIG